MYLPFLFSIDLAFSYILQISDLHISTSNKASGMALEKFCNSGFKKFLATGELDMVVISGDLVDGTPGLFSFAERKQFPEEWQYLTTTFHECISAALQAGVTIAALRGNHDAFGVKGLGRNGGNGYWLDFQDRLRPTWKFLKNWNDEKTGTQIFVVDKDKAVILIDNAFLGGSTRHFYGVWNFGTTEAILEGLQSLKGVKSVLLFSHYPIGTFRPADREKIFDCIALLERNFQVLGFHAGHLHTNILYPLGFFHNKYTKSFYEWEVPDFKSTKKVRLIGGDELNWLADFSPDQAGEWTQTHSISYMRILFSSRVGDLLKAKWLVADLDKSTSDSVFLSGNEAESYLTTRRTLSASNSLTPEKLEEAIDFERDDFFGRVGRSVFIKIPEFLQGAAFTAHGICLLISLSLYIRKKDSFAFLNLCMVGALPIIPLCIMQIEPGNYGLLFWWGALCSSGYRAFDITPILVTTIQGKAILLLTLRADAGFGGKWLKNAMIIPAIFVQLMSKKQFLIRGGPIALLGFSLIWDIIFWMKGGMVKWGDYKKVNVKETSDEEEPVESL